MVIHLVIKAEISALGNAEYVIAASHRLFGDPRPALHPIGKGERLIRKRIPLRRKQKRRHKILKRRTAPRRNADLASRGYHPPRHREIVLSRNGKRRRGKIARRPGFAHKRVIAGIAESCGFHIISDFEKPSVRIIKSAEVCGGNDLLIGINGIQKRRAFPDVFFESLAKRDKRRDKISAVHRRNKGLADHLQRPDIIPVVEMTVPRQHFGKRTQRPVRIGIQLFACDKIVVARRQNRQKIKPDIRRRRAHRDALRRRELIVVGRQEIRLLADHIPKIQP